MKFKNVGSLLVVLSYSSADKSVCTDEAVLGIMQDSSEVLGLV